MKRLKEIHNNSSTNIWMGCGKSMLVYSDAYRSRRCVVRCTTPCSQTSLSYIRFEKPFDVFHNYRSLGSARHNFKKKINKKEEIKKIWTILKFSKAFYTFRIHQNPCHMNTLCSISTLLPLKKFSSRFEWKACPIIGFHTQCIALTKFFPWYLIEIKRIAWTH